MSANTKLQNFTERAGSNPSTIRRSKRGTETSLTSSSSAKISRSSPSSQNVQSSRQRGKKGHASDVGSILESGRHRDVEFLIAAVDSTESDGIKGLSLKAPKWSAGDSGALESWLETLGFEEDYFGALLLICLYI